MTNGNDCICKKCWTELSEPDEEHDCKTDA